MEQSFKPVTYSNSRTCDNASRFLEERLWTSYAQKVGAGDMGIMKLKSLIMLDVVPYVHGYSFNSFRTLGLNAP